MTDIEKRLKEMEESIKVIAEFVKDQTDKLEAEISRPADYFDELGRIKETFSDEKEYSRLQAKKIDKLEEQIELIARTPRDKAIEDRFKRSIHDTRAELDNIKHELIPKVKFIEEKMDKIKDAVEDVNELHELKGYMSELEKKMESSIGNVEKQLQEAAKTNFGDKYKKELEGLNEGMLARFKDNSREYFEKLGYVEQRLNSLIEKVDKTPNSDILQKVRSLDEKLNDLKESLDTVTSMNPEEIREKVEFIDNKLNDALVNKSHLEDMEKSLRETKVIANRFRDNSMGYFQKLGYIEQRIDSLAEKVDKAPDGDILQKVRNLDAKLNDLKESMDSFTAMDTEEMKEKVEFIDNKLNEVMVSKNHLDDMERSIRETRAIANKFKNFDTDKYREEIFRQINEAVGSFKRTDFGEMKGIDQSLSKFRNLDINNIKKINEIAEEMKGIRLDDIKAIKDIDPRDLRRLSSTLEELKGVNMDDIGRLTRQLKDARESIRMEMGNRQATDEKLVSMESKIEELKWAEKKFDKNIDNMLHQFRDMGMHDVKDTAEQLREAREMLEDESVNRQSFEKRIMDLESKTEKIDSMEIRDIQDLAKEMTAAKETLEDESVNRQSIEKRLHAIETNIGNIQGMEIGQGNTEKIDVTKINNHIQDMESNMKLMTVKLLTQQLNEFAKSIDRRLPNIVSREEYLRQITDVQQRLRNIESPDLAPLGARVERLEKKLEEIAGMMRGMYNRIPIIVE